MKVVASVCQQMFSRRRAGGEVIVDLGFFQSLLRRHAQSRRIVGRQIEPPRRRGRYPAATRSATGCRMAFASAEGFVVSRTKVRSRAGSSQQTVPVAPECPKVRGEQ